MLVLNDRASQALRSLNGNADFEAILDWLRWHQTQLVKESEIGQEVPLYRNQGQRQLLSRLFQLQEEATQPRRPKPLAGF